MAAAYLQWKAQSCLFAALGLKISLSGQCGSPLRWHLFFKACGTAVGPTNPRDAGEAGGHDHLSSVSLGVGSQLLVWRRKRLGHWDFRIF